MLYSIIIPVFNRPEEVDELLESLTLQTYKDFEVIIIEDGSTQTCEHIVKKYKGVLEVNYFFKENSGQGFSRNYGFKRANGDYFVVFDSDCLIPPQYFQTVSDFLSDNPVDCWGGPDRAHPSFTLLQKAISFSMTSYLTTGGIRGRKSHASRFHPRSFNMGISRQVYERTGGYNITRMGEDIEFSIRIIKAGFRSALIEEAYVYHKRRTSLRQFFKQLHFFGRARININAICPGEIKFVHVLPVIFLTGLILAIALSFSPDPWFSSLILLYLIYAFILFFSALVNEKDLRIASLAVVAAFTQLSAYGLGFISEWFHRKTQKR